MQTSYKTLIAGLLKQMAAASYYTQVCGLLALQEAFGVQEKKPRQEFVEKLFYRGHKFSLCKTFGLI